jgi:hypothetical protein
MCWPLGASLVVFHYVAEDPAPRSFPPAATTAPSNDVAVGARENRPKSMPQSPQDGTAAEGGSVPPSLPPDTLSCCKTCRRKLAPAEAQFHDSASCGRPCNTRGVSEHGVGQHPCPGPLHHRIDLSRPAHHPVEGKGPPYAGISASSVRFYLSFAGVTLRLAK